MDMDYRMHGFVPAMAMVHVHGHCFQTPPDTGDFNDGQSFANNFTLLLGPRDFNELSVCQLFWETDR